VYGAIIGDTVGSTFEFANLRVRDGEPYRPRKDFELFHPKSTFTDDSVLTVATADVLLSGSDYAEAYRRYGLAYPGRGYGGRFTTWLASEDPRPYNSFGNGSAMRVSPVGWWFDTLKETLAEAARSAVVTHNHPEGIKGAQVTAGSIYIARTGGSKADVKRFAEGMGYSLDFSLDSIRPSYAFDETCMGTVPPAIKCVLEGQDYEDVIRLAISLGGDSDTLAAIAGGIAEAFFQIPWQLLFFARGLLDIELDVVMQAFYEALKAR